jgi:hypothetical protein
MKKNSAVATGLSSIFVLSLFAFGCAEQKTMQPMDTGMESMEKAPLHNGMGDMEKPGLKKDMTDSMEKPKTM